MRADLIRIARRVRRAARRLLRVPPPAAPAGAPSVLAPHQIAELARVDLEAISRALSSPVYLGGDVALCRVLARYKMFVDSRDISLAAHLLLDGFWEPWLTQFVARTVGPRSVVADIGANVGYYTMLLADLVGPSGKVFAVEPNPDSVELLRRSVLLNGFAGRTEIVEGAAGDAAGKATLWTQDSTPGGSSVIKPPGGIGNADAARAVPVVALDLLMAEESRLDFVKIDAEGSEERIIAGMRGLIQRHRPKIVLEFNPGWYADPDGFLSELDSIYGKTRVVDYAGEVVPADRRALLAEEADWSLLLIPS
ncbi:MAG TPA: FkbM family methyltransferase [Allosphingosinicella sp.]|nr:FkbM family methyltransferase [Allosphingosinicella sp.]HYG29785.1 FkbM family methyltransferase [Allosphingosinicella sp.]